MTGSNNRSAASRLIEFFRACPDEELSAEQIAAKFGVRRRTVYKILADLRQGGEIECVYVVRRREMGIAKEVQA